MLKTRRTILTAAALTAFMPSWFTARAASGKPSPVVVELFTSQGCSSCPPAEAYLAELAARDDILALEFHIDYWDYIGWEDPFADPRYTARQRRYNDLLDSRYNYTPQMVIDGRAHEVGSRRGAVDARIEAASMKRMMDADKSDRPTLALEPRSDGGFVLRLDGTPLEAGAYDVLLIGFDDQHHTEVLRGENTGRRLTNAHVVRSMASIHSGWRGGPVTIAVTPDQLAGDKGCAVLVQNPRTGTIAVAHQTAY